MSGLGDTKELIELCMNRESFSILDSVNNATGMGDLTSDALGSIGSGTGSAISFLGAGREHTLKGFVYEKGFKITGDDMMDYAMELLPKYGWMIVFLVFSLLCCPIVFICRCCRAHKCCRPKKLKYSKTSNLLYTLLYFVFAIITAIFGIVSILTVNSMYNTNFDLVCQLEDFRYDSLNFFTDLNIPVKKINKNSGKLIDNVEIMLASTDNIVSELDSVTDSLTDFASWMDTIESPDGYDFSMKDTSDQMKDIVAQIDSLAGPKIGELDDIKENVNGYLVQGKEQRRNIAKQANETTVSMKARVREAFDSSVIEMKKIFIDFEPTLKTLPVIVSGIVCFSVVVGIIGVLAYLSPCKFDDMIAKTLISFSWGFSYVIMILMFLVGTIFMITSVAYTDSCELIDDIPRNWDFYFGLIENGGELVNNYTLEGTQNVKILEGCFNVDADGNPAPIHILDSLGISEKFNISSIFNSFNLDDAKGLSEAFNFTELKSFEKTIDDLSLETFGVTQSSYDDLETAMTTIPDELKQALDEMNDVAPNTKIYTFDDCKNEGTCAPELENIIVDPVQKEKLNQLRDANVKAVTEVIKARLEINTTFWSAIDTMKTTVQEVKTRFKTVIDSVNGLEKSTENFNDKLGDVQTEMQPLIDAVNSLTSYGSCGFLKFHFDGLYDKMCEKNLSYVQNLGIYFLLIGLFSIPLITFANLLNVMLFGSGRSGVKPVEQFDTSSDGVY